MVHIEEAISGKMTDTNQLLARIARLETEVFYTTASSSNLTSTTIRPLTTLKKTKGVSKISAYNLIGNKTTNTGGNEAVTIDDTTTRLRSNEVGGPAWSRLIAATFNDTITPLMYTVARTTIKTYSVETIVDPLDFEDTTGWVISADAILTVTTNKFKLGTSALSLEKIGVSEPLVSMEKTGTLVDCTNRGWVLRVYVEDPTILSVGKALTIRFGTDSNNYYQYELPQSSLKIVSTQIETWNGSSVDTTTETQGTWNTVLDSSSNEAEYTPLGDPLTRTVVGAPDIENMGYMFIMAHVDDPNTLIAVDNIVIDNWKTFTRPSYAVVEDTTKL